MGFTSNMKLKSLDTHSIYSQLIYNEFFYRCEFFTININNINNSSNYAGNGLVYIGNASLENVNEIVYGITNPDDYKELVKALVILAE